MGDAIEFIEAVFGTLPQLPVPPWLLKAVVLALVVGLLVAAACWVLGKVADAWKTVQELAPRFSESERRRARRRRHFTEHLQNELQRLDNLESWQDFRFTDLEAEVEAEGRRGAFPGVFRFRGSRGLRRERSLSRALRQSRERLILIEGDPGSGKSVALRHVVRRLASSALRGRSPDSLVPLYINLKDFDTPFEDVSHDAVEKFVLRYLNRVARHDIDEFLEQEFRTGIERGTWFFFFDSFDEIPAILSAVEPDRVVQKFADALADFFAGLNRCRGVVATRAFRGPSTLPWARFRIMRLSARRQRQLIHNADLTSPVREALESGLYVSSSDIRAMSSNPMFLGLLCEHMKANPAFPQHSHNVFDSYFMRRLSRDRERVERRFELEPAQLTEAAEVVAFAMTASASIGLSPTRAQLHRALRQLDLDNELMDARLDALEYLKLARSEAESLYGGVRPFTFAHRRFQEYFATLYLMRNTSRIPPLVLLSDGRWRETAVVLFQTQSSAAAAPLVDAAAAVLGADVSPGRKLHVLGILQDGFSGRAHELADGVRELCQRVVMEIKGTNALIDEKLAVEHAGVIPTPSLEELINSSFDSGSRWLQESAFQQLARLVSISTRIHDHVAALMTQLLFAGRLRSERYAVQAQLQRIAANTPLMRVFRLFLAIQPIDLALHLLLFGSGAFVLTQAGISWIALMTTLTLVALVLAISRALLVNGHQPGAAAGMRCFVVATWMLIMMFAGDELVKRRRSDEILIVAFGAVPLLLWAPLAASAASRYARYVTPLTWPFLPLFELVSGFRALREHWRGFLGLAGFLVAFVWISESDILRTLIPQGVRNWTFGTIAGLYVVLMLAMSWSACRLFLEFLASRWTIYSMRSPISTEKLKSLIGRWQGSKTRAVLLDHVRRHGLIAPEDAAVAYMRTLALELDVTVHRQRSRDPNDPPESLDRVQRVMWYTIAWVIRNVFRYKESFPVKVEPGLLEYRDEAFRLHEQLAAASHRM
jgi:hypothetical protein